MAEPYVIKMPQLSDTMTEGVVVTWEKNIGDKVERGDIVATVETDKAIMDVEVFREGFLSGPISAIDSVVPVGGAMAYIVESAAEVQGEGAQAPVEAAAPAAAEAPAAVEPAKPEGATHIIKMPQLSDTMTEGLVVSWEKEVGDKVERGDIVAQVETDKAIMDVEVFREGYLSGPISPVDAVVPVGGAMAYLVDSADQVMTGEAAPVAKAAKHDSASSPSAQEPRHAAASHPVPGNQPPPLRSGDIVPAPRPDNKHATPYARQLAGAMGINLNNLKGHGPDGVITGDDVRRAQPIARPTQIAAQVPAHVLPEIQVPGNGRPMTAMERAVSASMTASLTMPTFHVSAYIPLAKIIKASKKAGVSVTVAIAKACALAMKKHPTMNWTYQPVDKLVERDNVDIGMAVSADGGGLVVPVL
ncbi:MAG: 2-oxo acid dehydrogenase subunit E2, partial [Gammaproteobacteria bacterium]|nr:2-oxo acid dehydrogenase subunit E2 [Gammaproteobacteria bacterium]